MQLPNGAVIGGWLPENPLPAFITVDLMTSNEIGQATREFDGKRERIIQSMQSTVSLSCFGRNSLAQCYKLKPFSKVQRFFLFSNQITGV
nr:hypothetical protein [Haemophilus influenzae]